MFILLLKHLYLRFIIYIYICLYVTLVSRLLTSPEEWYNFCFFFLHVECGFLNLLFLKKLFEGFCNISKVLRVYMLLTLKFRVESVGRITSFLTILDACREYREHVKDLTCISKDLGRVVIVDNNPFSFVLQPVNGIPCIPFSAGHPHDTQVHRSVLLKNKIIMAQIE